MSIEFISWVKVFHEEKPKAEAESIKEELSTWKKEILEEMRGLLAKQTEPPETTTDVPQPKTDLSDRIAKRKEEIQNARKAKTGDDEFSRVCDGFKIPQANRKLIRPLVASHNGDALQRAVAAVVKDSPILLRSTAPTAPVTAGKSPGATRKDLWNAPMSERIEELKDRLAKL
jgi:hypothetical protein